MDPTHDTVDVDMTPEEAFSLTDFNDPEGEQDDEQRSEDQQGAEGEETSQDSTADDENEQRISRRDRRINQLVARAKEAEEARAAAEAALQLEREKHAASSQDGAADEELSGLDEQIAMLDQQIAAETDDDSMQAALKSQKFLLARERSRIMKEREQRSKPVEQPEQEQSAPPHPSTQKWLEDNKWYAEQDEWGRIKNPTLYNVATEEYHRLRREMGGDSPELFQKLDDTLRELPEFELVLKPATQTTDASADKQDAGNKAPSRPPRQNTSPSRTQVGNDEPPVTRTGEPRLDKHDLQKMRAFGLNPDDPKARKAYIDYNPRKFSKGAA